MPMDPTPGPRRTEPSPTLGRIVHYISNTGSEHAAIIARPDRPGSDEIELIVFGFNGTGAYPIYATKGPGKGQWHWPEHVPPIVTEPTRSFGQPGDHDHPAKVGLGAGVGLGHSIPSQGSTQHGDFGWALAVMRRQSATVQRIGWNGKGQFLFYMPGYPDGVPANAATARAMNVPVGHEIRVRPYIGISTVDGSIVPWQPSQSDMLAEDWVCVGVPG